MEVQENIIHPVSSDNLCCTCLVCCRHKYGKTMLLKVIKDHQRSISCAGCFITGELDVCEDGESFDHCLKPSLYILNEFYVFYFVFVMCDW